MPFWVIVISVSCILIGTHEIYANPINTGDVTSASTPTTLPVKEAKEIEKGIIFTVLTDKKKISEASSTNIFVTLENESEQEIEDVRFLLINSDFQLSTVEPLDSEVPSKGITSGIYSIQINKEATYTLVGRLDYRLNGEVNTEFSQSELEFVEKKGNIRDFWLILAGAGAGVLGGSVSEAIRGWFSYRRESAQDIKKAIGLFLPSLDVCKQAIQFYRDAPIESWEKVYFQQGLYIALSKRAREIGLNDLTQDISKLYAQLEEYNTNRQNVNRTSLLTDLEKTRKDLNRLM